MKRYSFYSIHIILIFLFIVSTGTTMQNVWIRHLKFLFELVLERLVSVRLLLHTYIAVLEIYAITSTIHNCLTDWTKQVNKNIKISYLVISWIIFLNICLFCKTGVWGGSSSIGGSNSMGSAVGSLAPSDNHTNEIWLRAATIAVPICGALILFLLIAIAVKILRNDALDAANKLRYVNYNLKSNEKLFQLRNKQLLFSVQVIRLREVVKEV